MMLERSCAPSNHNSIKTCQPARLTRATSITETIILSQAARVRAHRATKIRFNTNTQRSMIHHLVKKNDSLTYRRSSRLSAEMTSTLAHARKSRLWTTWEKSRASRLSEGQDPSRRFKRHKCHSMQISQVASFLERIQTFRSTKALEVNTRSCL